ncbi:hypothetical protein BpHYR1_037097 [Brachionus plicatilis]|uniref:Uncharacterized protein n=1 Tax=Brachionus plicatilis TaxID=10195 RepID=A0A3M7RE50_BRAPC|nr:hypothetical protein BpHYR1_037097 [Brachionus plicatilis]
MNSPQSNQRRPGRPRGTRNFSYRSDGTGQGTNNLICSSEQGHHLGRTGVLTRNQRRQLNLLTNSNFNGSRASSLDSPNNRSVNSASNNTVQSETSSDTEQSCETSLSNNSDQVNNNFVMTPQDTLRYNRMIQRSLENKFDYKILGATSNLVQHIDSQHDELSDWLDAYRRWTKRGKKIKNFSEKEILIVKYFLTSNNAGSYRSKFASSKLFF